MEKQNFMLIVHDMGYKHDEFLAVERAFDSSTIIHSNEERADGKPYVIHPIEVALSSMRTQRTLGIRDWRATVGCLIHDGMESIMEMGVANFHNFDEIANFFHNTEVGVLEDLAVISKSHETAYKDEYFPRLLKTKRWRALWNKFEDRTNNAETFHKIPHNFERKIMETQMYFPALAIHLKHLIIEGGAFGEFKEEGWLKLPEYLFDKLNNELKKYERKMEYPFV